MASSAGFNAFISYSHEHDSAVALAVQTGLERFAKPWYTIRSARIFRDAANLAASPALWKSIEDALGSSQWFILLASPGSAKSPWVNQEVEWWLAHHSPERLLVVATGPGLAWDEQKGDWVAGAPVPPALHHAFTGEPHWVDLTDVQLDHRRPRVPADRLAALAAAIRGVDKDTVIGEHLRQHRRTMRLARGAVAVLTVLTVLAVSAALIALGQRDDARTQARLATSREYAALAVSSLTSDLGVAQLLAVAAYRLDENPQTEAALLQAVAAGPHLVRYLPVGAQVTALGTAADGRVVVAGTADGRLMKFSLHGAEGPGVETGLGSITDIAVSADGGAVAATDGSGAVFWATGRQRAVMIGGDHSVSSVAISPSGQTAAVVGQTVPSPDSPDSALVRVNSSGREKRISVPAGDGTAALPADSTLTLIGNNVSEEWSLPDLRLRSKSTGPILPAGDYSFGASVNGSYAAFTKYGNVYVWSTTRGLAYASVNSLGPSGVSSDLEIAPDGKSVALVDSGTIYVAQDIGSQQGTAPSVTRLTGGGTVTAAQFLGNGSQLVSASGTNLELWDLRQNSRLGQPTGVSIPDGETNSAPPSLAFSPDGRRLAIVDATENALSVYSSGPRFSLASTRADANLIMGVPLWQGKNLLLVNGIDGNGNLSVTNAGGKVLQSWTGLAKYGGLLSARLLPGQDQLITVDNYGGVEALDLRTRAARPLYPDQSVIKGNEFILYQADISPDGSAAVITEWRSNSSGPRAVTPVKLIYVDLRTGRSRVLGSGGADAAVFADGRLIVQRASGNLELWDEAGQHLLRTLPGSGNYTFSLAVSPSGTLLARLLDDGTASVTDLTTGAVLASFQLPAPVDSIGYDPWLGTALAFTPDGQELLTATTGGQMMSWDLAGGALIERACATAGRNLTAAEWTEYIQAIPPASLLCAG